MDLVVSADKMPDQGETLKGNSFFTNPGGKGANQAVAIAKLGGKVEMVGAVGKEFGQELISDLKKYQVSTKYVAKYDDVSSGIAVIVLTNGDNRIIINSGSNDRISEKDIDLALSEACEGDFLLCQLEIPIALVEYALKKGKEIGMITFLNTAPALSLSANIFPLCDYLISNQKETELYSNIYPFDKTSVRKAAQNILNLGVRNSLITLGEKGSYFLNDKEEHYVPSFPVKPVDTTGAGDTYVGAFLTFLSEKNSLKYCLEKASLAASITIQRLGAQKAIPYRREIEEKMS